jgi:hypothetical protein
VVVVPLVDVPLFEDPRKPYRILVTGSRDWQDRFAVYVKLSGICEAMGLNFPPDQYGNTSPDWSRVTVVHGACPTGADFWADQWCLSNQFVAETHPADWSLGRKAGPLRNNAMVALGADVCVAFIGACTSPRCTLGGARHDSHGATGAAAAAERAGIPVLRVRDDS